MACLCLSHRVLKVVLTITMEVSMNEGSTERVSTAFLSMFVVFLITCFFLVKPSDAQVLPPPLSLKDVPVLEPTNLHAFLKGNPGSQEGAEAKRLALVLGKALFWDMQVGSDGVQACASCHFNAGADVRSKNQLTPMDGIFGNSGIATVPEVPGPNDPPFNYGFGPNFEISAEHFPFHRRTDPTAVIDPLAEFAGVLMDTNDVLSSQGVRVNDSATDPLDPIFNWKNANQRKVEPRNSPSMINAVFHVDMFWDGRASSIFNGVNPFGFRDLDSTIKKNFGPAEQPDIRDIIVRIPFAAHASQSVGPPLSTLEMTGHERNFPELAAKLLAPNLMPLGLQVVHPEDSVLGAHAVADFIRNRNGKPTSRLDERTGITVSYEDLIKGAFKEEWWNADSDLTQMKSNFSLFFGLAMQLYQGLLVADDTPFDRFMGANVNVRGGGPIPADPTALTAQEQLGLDLFMGAGMCNNCHLLPESSNHVVRLAGFAPPKDHFNDPLDPVNVLVPQTILELMPMGDGLLGVYDTGFYNIGVRPTEEDIGRAATAPSGLPLSYVELAYMKLNNDPPLPPDVARFVPDQGIEEVVQNGTVVDVAVPLVDLFARADRRVTRGAFKVPTLRNQQFQGPYFHNGGDATLRQVVEFYARGGNFPITNREHLDADITFIPEFDIGDPVMAAQAEANIQALVAFLSRGLTDDRVVNKQAPFDHPQLFIPEGVTGNLPDIDKMKEIKATGATGSGPISTFLILNPQMP